jgi:hypothetical protein
MKTKSSTFQPAACQHTNWDIIQKH